jgi:hypothetical protein
MGAPVCLFIHDLAAGVSVFTPNSMIRKMSVVEI